MKTALLLFSLILYSGCMPSKSVDANTSTGNINVSAPYLWTSYSASKDLPISETFTDAEVANITAMTTAWESGLENKKDFFKHTYRATEISAANLNLDNLDDSVFGIYQIRHWPSSLPGSALAVTQLFGRRYNIGKSNEYVNIEHADILLNDHFYNFRTGDAGTGFDLQTVILHELGHFLGLPHRTGNTVMISSIDDDVNSRAPTSIDKSDLASKYGISLSAGALAMVGKTPNYAPASGDTGKQIKILIELHASGICVHKEDGAVTQRHPASLK